jgi:hypothetical protein
MAAERTSGPVMAGRPGRVKDSTAWAVLFFFS